MYILNNLIPIAQAQSDEDFFDHHMMFDSFSNTSLAGYTFMFIFWLFIIAGAVLFFMYLAKNKNGSQKEGSKGALDILKERYAKGEISKEEFEEKKKDII